MLSASVASKTDAGGEECCEVENVKFKSLYKGLNSVTNLAIGVTYVAIVPCILFTYDISLIQGGPGMN